MIKFEECSISTDGLNLHIKASIIDSNDTKDLYIKSLYIDTENTVLSNIPSSDSYIKDFGEIEEVAFLSGEDEANTVTTNQQTIYKNKDIDITISPSMLGISNFDNNVFFIYIEITGSPNSLVTQNKYSSKAVVNFNTIYKKILSHIKELDNNCDIPRNFIDFILRLKALDLAVKTENNNLIVSYWNKLFKN